MSMNQESIIDWECGALGAGGAGLAAYGRLLLDGELKVKAHEDQKLRTRYVFVFDKLMLLCKPVKVRSLISSSKTCKLSHLNV